MTIQERLKRSNLIMLVVPFAIAGVLLVVWLVAGVILLQTVYLPRPGLTLRDLHAIVEKMESMLKGLKLFVVLYAAVVVAALLAAVGFTNFYLTKVLLGWAAGSWRSRT